MVTDPLPTEDDITDGALGLDDGVTLADEIDGPDVSIVLVAVTVKE